MKITFVLPCPSWMPIGGFKVVYEYANRLTSRGHTVTLIHPFFCNKENGSRNQSLLSAARYLRCLLKSSITKPWHWFKINPDVRMKLTPNLEEVWMPDSHAIVATTWNIAEHVAPFSLRKGHKFYFIQGLDTCFNQTNPSRIMDTWKLPYHKIVISRWLESIARNHGENCTYIPNAVDFNEFCIETPIETRSARTLCLIYKKDTFKGISDGKTALNIVKEKVPEITVLMFGTDADRDVLPLHATYYKNPKPYQIKDIYNRSAIFIGTSWCEGFGLPPCEAAACGSALCVADNGGHREYAVPDKTALLHPPRRPDILAKNILCLLKDNDRRIRIAQDGNSYIKNFSWDRSADKFERTLLQGAENHEQ